MDDGIHFLQPVRLDMCRYFKENITLTWSLKAEEGRLSRLVGMTDKPTRS